MRSSFLSRLHHFHLRKKTLTQLGMTMIELLSVLAILSILILIAMFASRAQITKGQDSKRKSDFQAYKIALEQYYEDNRCYPDESVLQDCGGGGMKPYLSKILCDPRTKQPYRYVKMACNKYAIWTNLESPRDPDVLRWSENGTGTDVHFGWDDEPSDGASIGSYNYGISSSNVRFDSTFAYGEIPPLDNCWMAGHCTCDPPGSPGACPGSMICDTSLEFCYEPDGNYIDDGSGGGGAARPAN